MTRPSTRPRQIRLAHHREDPERFAQLMRTAFGLRVSERHFVWKYDEKPSVPVVGFEAIGPEGPVGFYGAIPRDVPVSRQADPGPPDGRQHDPPRLPGKLVATWPSRARHVRAPSYRGGRLRGGVPNRQVALIVRTTADRLDLRHTSRLVVLPRIVHLATAWRSKAKDVALTTGAAPARPRELGPQWRAWPPSARPAVG